MKTPKSNKSSNPKNQLKPQKHSNNNQKIKYPQYYSNTHKIPPILELEKKAYIKFKNLYINDENFYNIKTINEIICNESSHIVALFKDYLIYGDYSEFLQGSYSLGESKDILPKIYEYYESCSVIFPNYIILPESKYIYKNIQRKQRVIDNQQELEQEEELRKREEKNNIHKEEVSNVFDTQAVDSILNQTDTSTIRIMMGMTKEVTQKDSIDEESETTSYEKIIDLINQAEFWSQEHTARKIVNCALRLKHHKIIQKKSISSKSKSKSKISNSSNINNSHAVKGRNYNRISNVNMSSINKMNSTTEKDTKAKVKTTIKNLQNNNDKEMQTFYNNITTSKNKVHHRHNNSHNVKKGIIHSLLSSNFDLIRKTFKELAKKSSYRNSTKINAVTSPNNERVYKQTGNKLMSSISSPKSNLRPSSHSKSTISMTKLSGQIFGFISKYKSKKTSKVNHSKNSKDCDKKISNKPDLLFITHNIPLTSRDQHKNSMNQDIMTFLEPKQTKEKHVKNSMSISHKKTFTSSSLGGTATGSLNNNFQQNEEKTTVNNKANINPQKTQTTTVTHRNERNSFNYLDDLLTKTGGGNSQARTQSGKMKNSKIVSKFGSNTNSKVLKTYTHYQSNSSLTGDKSKDKKQPNAVIPIRKELNIKGIKIKGFDELLSKNYYSSRNNNSHSDRVKIGFINNSDISSKRNKNKTCIPNTPFNKGYYEVFKTTAKK